MMVLMVSARKSGEGVRFGYEPGLAHVAFDPSAEIGDAHAEARAPHVDAYSIGPVG